MARTAEMIVWAQDQFSYDVIPPTFTVFRPDESEVKARYIFVLTSVADLPTVSDFVRAANQRNHLRTLFVREDGNAQFFAADALRGKTQKQPTYYCAYNEGCTKACANGLEPWMP